MGQSIHTPLPSIHMTRLGSKQWGEAIVTKQPQRWRALRTIILITGLESKTRTHKALNAGSAERWNQSPVKFRTSTATFGHNLPLTRPFPDLLRIMERVWASGTVNIAGDRHASRHKPRTERRSHRRRRHGRPRSWNRKPKWRIIEKNWILSTLI